MPRGMPPPRKEPKETVVYAASKRKAEPFKPHRPSQVPRTDAPTTESGNFTRPGAGQGTTGVASSRAMGKASMSRRKEDETREGEGGEEGSESSDEGLGDDPLAVTKTATARTTKKPPPPARPTKKPAAAAAKEQKPSIPIPSSPSSTSPRPSSPPLASTTVLPPPTQLADPTLIPLPLLTRLLHQHFTHKQTQIDKHALQVVQKYLEVFVREAIARAAAGKREKAERGEVEGGEERWLEVEDLEGVAAGVMMDF